MVTLPHGKPVILFDGVCNLCRMSVQFVISHDPKGRFQFASQQSEIGQTILGARAGSLESVYLVDHKGIHTRSTAVLRVMRGLGFPWSLFYGFIIIPKALRDFVYNFVGRRRYAWFGKMGRCWIPDPALKSRFLDGV